jgi:hypothetical protein
MVFALSGCAEINPNPDAIRPVYPEACSDALLTNLTRMV